MFGLCDDGWMPNLIVAIVLLSDKPLGNLGKNSGYLRSTDINSDVILIVREQNHRAEGQGGSAVRDGRCLDLR